MSDSLVIIPTYNEKENIANIIAAVFDLSVPFHVLIVDDGSPDGTADIVRTLQKEKYNGQLFLEERTGKLGLGTAYIHGFKWALKRDYQYICEMDADFSHPPQKLIELRAACLDGTYGAALGSRYTKGGGVKNWPMNRLMLSRGASFYVQAITFMPVQDPTAGFICYTRKALEAINFEKITFVGYAFQIEMKFAIHQLGFKLKEVPIIFKDREEGHSKMNGSIIKEAVFGVLNMRWFGWTSSYGKSE